MDRCECNGILNASGCSLTVAASSIAIALSNRLSEEDLTTIGGFFTALGDLILLNVEQNARRAACLKDSLPKDSLPKG